MSVIYLYFKILFFHFWFRNRRSLVKLIATCLISYAVQFYFVQQQLDGHYLVVFFLTGLGCQRDAGINSFFTDFVLIPFVKLAELK